jgi:eukaryotic-like serine/threonine-protein kinase
VYVRSQAYLATHQGAEAAREFQKIVDHRGITIGDAFGALAHLGLAREYVVSGDAAKLAAPTKTSSHSGKTPILTSRF